MKHTEIEMLKECLNQLRAVVVVLKDEADKYALMTGRASQAQLTAISCIESGIETIAESDDELTEKEEEGMEDDFLGRFKEHRDARAIVGD